MNDYYSVRFTIEPPSADAADLLAYDLGEIGYESFVGDDRCEGASLTAYIPAGAYDEAATAAVAAGRPFTAEFIEGRDWNAEWEKNYFKPIVVDGRVVVFSSFHTEVPDAEYRITVNPKMAFGTGHHATTNLMMRAILAADCRGLEVVDMGTGTGILGILAAMRGAAHVLAVEIDPFAAENAVENVALNLGDSVVVKVVNSDASVLDGRDFTADLFLANINRNIITADIGRYAAAMRRGATLVTSGFYVSDRPVVAAAAAAAGLEAAGADEIDSWSSLTFVKP